MTATLKHVGNATKRLSGFFPVYKESGLHYIDLLDSIRLTLAFELNASKQGNVGSQSMDCFPKLRKEDAGIVNIALGSVARKSLNIFRRAECVYHVSAQLGQRMPQISYDGIISKSFGELLVSSSPPVL